MQMIRSSVPAPANLAEGAHALLTAIVAAIKDPKSLDGLADVAKKINGINKITEEEAVIRDQAIQTIKNATEALDALAAERAQMDKDRELIAQEKMAHQTQKRAIEQQHANADVRDAQYDRQQGELRGAIEEHGKAVTAFKVQAQEVHNAGNRNKIEAARLAELRESLEAREAKLKQVQNILGNGHDERKQSNGLVPVQPGAGPGASS